MAYTKAQFDEYYGDLDTALDFWVAAGGVALAAAPKPLERFAPGSIVRVLPDSRPGVRPEHAEGLLSANIHSEEVHEDGEVFCFVSPMGSNRKRKVSANLIVEASLDGSFRGEGRGGGAARDIARARSGADRESAAAARSALQASTTAAIDVLSAQRRAEKAEAAAAKKVTRALQREETVHFQRLWAYTCVQKNPRLG